MKNLESRFEELRLFMKFFGIDNSAIQIFYTIEMKVTMRLPEKTRQSL